MDKRNILIVVVLLILLVAGNWWYAHLNNKVPPPAEDSGDAKADAEIFSGKLEKVDTGCFADGECYIVVNGKHVTVLMGWSQATVGSVLGVEGFSDLESHIGEEVEVYAQKDPEGTYSLYGSEDFYLKLK